MFMKHRRGSAWGELFDILGIFNTTGQGRRIQGNLVQHIVIRIGIKSGFGLWFAYSKQPLHGLK